MSNPFLHARREAQALIKKYRISKPNQIDVEAIAGLLNVFINEKELIGAEACLLIHENYGLVSIQKNIHERGRKRFAIAHEIGHYLLHKSIVKKRDCTAEEFLRWYSTNDEEPEANVFAAELLMPETLFSLHCQGSHPNFRVISELADIFGASLTATAYRYVEIGNYPCALIAAREGRIVWFTTSNDFGFRVHSVGKMVDKNSAAGEYFSSSNFIQDKPEPIEGSAWLELIQNDHKIVFYESMISLDRYHTTLSLIYSK